MTHKQNNVLGEFCPLEWHSIRNPHLSILPIAPSPFKASWKGTMINPACWRTPSVVLLCIWWHRMTDAKSRRVDLTPPCPWCPSTLSSVRLTPFQFYTQESLFFFPTDSTSPNEESQNLDVTSDTTPSRHSLSLFPQSRQRRLTESSKAVPYIDSWEQIVQGSLLLCLKYFHV